MTISVAMCTYNGAKYLQEQLDSIESQRRSPDELIICDDGSQDETVQIAQTFLARASFPVHLVINECNLGSTKNFEQAIMLCQSDVVALSDQDDVWHDCKLQRIEEAFNVSDAIGLVFSDGEIVDQDLRPLGARLWDSAHITRAQARLIRDGNFFKALLIHNIVTGAAMAFRTEFRKLFLPIPNEIPLIHDGWIALMISAAAEVTLIPEPLIYYRQHPQQQLGAVLERTELAKRVLPESHYRGHITQIRLLVEHLMACQNILPNATERIEFFQEHIRHIETRLALPRSRFRRLPLITQELLTGRYHGYSSGLASVVRDLLYGR